jgi:hypothetical protein
VRAGSAIPLADAVDGRYHVDNPVSEVRRF